MKTAYDPRGTVGTDSKALSGRVKSLDGLRVGVLDNTKWNANKLLREVRDQLKAGHKFGAVNYYRKEAFSRFADAELIKQIRAENDVVVTAIGD